MSDFEIINSEKHKWWHRIFEYWRETETINGITEFKKWACPFCDWEKRRTRRFKF